MTRHDPAVRIIYGPPGTGKTTRLLREVQVLLRRGVHPRDIAFVSHTRRAVHEALTRSGLNKNKAPFFCTLHSLGYALNEYERKQLFSRDDWKVLERRFGGLLAEQSRNSYSDDDFDRGLIATMMKSNIMEAYQYHRATGKSLGDVHSLKEVTCDLQTFTEILELYRRYKLEHGKIDFSDMLNIPRASADVKHVFIDEAQDLSWQQWAFSLAVFSRADVITVCGDDDQAIYEWSGADVQTFLQLEGEKETLQKSYRVPRLIHEKAQQIIAGVHNRVEKDYEPTEEKGSIDYIIDPLSADLNRGTWLLLSRTAHQAKRVSNELRRRLLPHSVGHDRVTDVIRRKPRALWSKEDAYLVSLKKTNDFERVRVSTVHEAKGAEADNVVIDLSSTLRLQASPVNRTRAAQDAELRVQYVAFTRARFNTFIVNEGG